VSRQRYALIFERTAAQPNAEVIAEHRRRLGELARLGLVVMAGPFEGGGGIVILEVASRSEAEAVVEADPFVVQGTHSYRLVRWLQDLGPGATE